MDNSFWWTALAPGLVLVPLLRLMVNQLSKPRMVDQRHSTVNTVRINKTSRSNLLSQVIPKTESMANHELETLVLLSSPQYIADMPAFLSTLLKCSNQQILRLVTINEAHLVAMHWATFRQSIRVLRDVLFAKLYVSSLLYYPLLLAMTALTLIRSLSLGCHKGSASLLPWSARWQPGVL